MPNIRPTSGYARLSVGVLREPSCPANPTYDYDSNPSNPTLPPVAVMSVVRTRSVANRAR